MRPLLALVIALGVASQAPAAELARSDREQLLRLAQRMDEAWTAGDPEANAKLFVPHATARFGDDALGEGREAILSQFAGFFKDRPPGLRHVTNIERTEPLADDLVMWDAEVRVESRQADGRWSTLTRIRNVTIAVRQPDGWRIRDVRAFPVPKMGLG